MNKGKIEEYIFNSGIVDKKHKLNVLNKEVPEELIQNIDKGVTIEFLENSGYPVFTYNTQITIHGLFPVKYYSSVYGYKYIFQNKNKSIGVKYNAIDIKKKMLVRKYLKLYNWHCQYDSNNFTFYQQSNFVSKKEELLDLGKKYIEIANKIKSFQHLFNGTIQVKLYNALYYGYCLSLELNINSIYRKNLKEFIEKTIDKTIKESGKALIDNKRKARESDKQRHIEYEHTKQVSDFIELQKKKVIDILKQKIATIGEYKINNVDTGYYLKVTKDSYPHRIGYKKIYLYKENNRKHYYNFKETKIMHNLQDCINTKEYKESYSRNQWKNSKGIISGIKLNII